ncbi:GpE family phage tail protein [Elstera cyanobacteriorum]|nr:GpE family phage tail protein [Elstera cyanobacteriorum]
MRADIAAIFHWQPSEIRALTVEDFLLAHAEAEARVLLMRGGR